MTSQPGLQTIAIYILPNYSQSKHNQTMKFGQLIEYNRNIFLQKSYRKWGRETSSKLPDFSEWKELLRGNKKHFPSFLKVFQLAKIASDLRVHL